MNDFIYIYIHFFIYRLFFCETATNSSQNLCQTLIASTVCSHPGMFSSVTLFLEASGRVLAILLPGMGSSLGLWSSHCPGTSHPITRGSLLLTPILGACFLVSIASFIWLTPSFWCSESSSSFLRNIVRHFMNFLGGRIHRLKDQLDAG